MNLTLALDMNDLTDAEAAHVIGQVAETVIAKNLQYLKLHPSTPQLAKSGVAYKPDDGTWGDIPNTIAHGGGDAQELVCWRIAELRARGVAAKVYVVVFRDGKDLSMVHLQVLLPGGEREDPAHKLGMKAIPLV